jgi:P2 family phage contractile tail tube protein
VKKTINVVGSAFRVIDGAPKEASDFVSVTLPSIENAMETIKGTGILGEAEVPTTAFLAPMTLGIASKSSEGLTDLLVPGTHKVEAVWIQDVLDTSGMKIGSKQNKMIANGFTKKFDEGGVEQGSGTDINVELALNTYSRYVDGKPILEIDKFNGVYKVNGVDQISKISALLK